MRAALVVVAVLVLAGSAIAAGTLISDWKMPIGEDVAVIHMDGYMVTESVPSGFGLTSSETVSKSIRQAVEDYNTKAIVLRINSPGGSPAAAEEIRAEVMRAKDAGKPVVVSMGSVAASAAYHVASACDYIMCSNSTITGSLGVVWVFEDRSDYYDKEGIKFFIAKNGTLKDMGTDTRALTEQEKAYAQEVVGSLFEMLIADVRLERNITEENMSYISDSRVLTGREAVRLGLADGNGGLFDAAEKAAELAGLSRYSVEFVESPSIASLLFGSQSNCTQVQREQHQYVGVGRLVSAQ
ncbi:MAG: signal peptide peptidase SppA [Methermicoccaceae archaeon]